MEVADKENTKHSLEFEPVLFICERYPSLSFQPSRKNEEGVVEGLHWTFDSGIFICLDPDTLAVMHDYLKKASPYVRQLIREATSQDEANNLRIKNMMQHRRERLAIAGPFTSDVMGARNQEITEVQLQADMARMGIDPAKGADGSEGKSEFAKLAEQLKTAGNAALGEGGDGQI